jgi:hypothetical protein
MSALVCFVRNELPTTRMLSVRSKGLPGRSAAEMASLRWIACVGEGKPFRVRAAGAWNATTANGRTLLPGAPRYQPH